jgi:hypothetical protein
MSEAKGPKLSPRSHRLSAGSEAEMGGARGKGGGIRVMLPPLLPAIPTPPVTEADLQTPGKKPRQEGIQNAEEGGDTGEDTEGEDTEAKKAEEGAPEKEQKPSAVRGNRRRCFRYALTGVINHVGSLQGGHYTAYVRSEDYKSDAETQMAPNGSTGNSNDSVKKPRWYHFNDECVDEVKNPSRSLVSPAAYVLFYTRVDCLPGADRGPAADPLHARPTPTSASVVTGSNAANGRSSAPLSPPHLTIPADTISSGSTKDEGEQVGIGFGIGRHFRPPNADYQEQNERADPKEVLECSWTGSSPSRSGSFDNSDTSADLPAWSPARLRIRSRSGNDFTNGDDGSLRSSFLWLLSCAWVLPAFAFLVSPSEWPLALSGLCYWAGLDELAESGPTALFRSSFWSDLFQGLRLWWHAVLLTRCASRLCIVKVVIPYCHACCHTYYRTC